VREEVPGVVDCGCKWEDIAEEEDSVAVGVEET
jgi:hypothetical protein